jgi:hypothetical protein
VSLNDSGTTKLGKIQNRYIKIFLVIPQTRTKVKLFGDEYTFVLADIRESMHIRQNFI